MIRNLIHLSQTRTFDAIVNMHARFGQNKRDQIGSELDSGTLDFPYTQDVGLWPASAALKGEKKLVASWEFGQAFHLGKIPNNFISYKVCSPGHRGTLGAALSRT